MPVADGALRATRVAHGWSQARAATELASLAAGRGLGIATTASLKTQLSRWENHHVVPDETYRSLLRELYGRSDVDLGFSTRAPVRNDEDGLLRAELANAAATDARAIELLWAQLAASSAVEARLGATAVEETVQGQLSHVERLLTHAVNPDTRRQLARLVGAASLAAGRAAGDGARVTDAWRHFERARRAGHEAGELPVIAWSMLEQADLLVDCQREPVALELLGRLDQLAGADSARRQFAGWLAVYRGRAFAAAGSADQARSAYRTAATEAQRHQPVIDHGYPAGIVLEFDAPALHRHRGHGLRLLRQDREAVVELELALAEGGSIREVAAVHVDLTGAFGALSDTASAREHARIARELADRIGSAKLTARLDRALGRDLSPS